MSQPHQRLHLQADPSGCKGIETTKQDWQVAEVEGDTHLAGLRIVLLQAGACPVDLTSQLSQLLICSAHLRARIQLHGFRNKVTHRMLS